MKELDKICSIELFALLKKFAEKVNGGWKPDWNNSDEPKWGVVLDMTIVQWICWDGANCMSPTEIHFKTRQLAQQAIDEIIIPLVRGEL